MTVQLDRWFRRATVIGGCLLMTGLQGCSLKDLVDVDPTSIGSTIATQDLESHSAALMLYNYAVGATARAWSVYSYSSGLWTDELTDLTGNATLARFDARDTSSANVEGSGYRELQNARSSIGVAIEALRAYPGPNNQALLSEMFALQGYTVLMLGEGFCAGVPLSHVGFDGDIHFSEGESTETLFITALAMFDTALRDMTDSLPLITLARVGAARAQLNLGRYDAAKRAVESVSQNAAAYVLYYSMTSPDLAHWSFVPAQVVNREGTNGMDWIATPPITQDVRLPVSAGFQQKFTGIVTSAVMADGIEAGLIVSEAQLRTDGETGTEWLRILNALRATRVSTTGARLLPDLSDPGTMQGRIDLLFRERAFWMYLTGHRQGDLRRLIRQYSRPTSEVYPWGDYASTITPRYLADVVIGIHYEEQSNPLFRGCHDTNP